MSHYVGSDFSEAIIIALGSSLAGPFESREDLIEAALSAFEDHGLHVIARSRHWRSAAWPDPAHPEFRNVIAIVEPGPSAETVLASLQRIEAKFGRERKERNGPRTLDLDLIAVGREVVDTQWLTLPHPRAHERRFVMAPLAEIVPGWLHPVSQRRAADLAAEAIAGNDAAPVRGWPVG